MVDNFVHNVGVELSKLADFVRDEYKRIVGHLSPTAHRLVSDLHAQAVQDYEQVKGQVMEDVTTAKQGVESVTDDNEAAPAVPSQKDTDEE